MWAGGVKSHVEKSAPPDASAQSLAERCPPPGTWTHTHAGKPAVLPQADTPRQRPRRTPYGDRPAGRRPPPCPYPHASSAPTSEGLFNVGGTAPLPPSSV